MKNQKIKILFITNHLFQGGAERYIFEVFRALDKDKFEVGLLVPHQVDEKHYYYSRLRELGLPIYRKLPRFRYFKGSLFGLYNRISGLERFVEMVQKPWLRLKFRHLIKPYDLICINLIENYYTVQHLLEDNRQIIVHLMSNKFQYSYDLYADCLPDRQYRFVLMDPRQREEIQDSPCAHADTVYVPLSLDFNEREYIYKLPVQPDPVKIGIFMRVSVDRPIEFLFYCFQMLLQNVEATLHIYGGQGYGRGNPGMFYRTLDFLRIRDKVIFEGHRENLEETLREDNLSLVWMTSHGPTLGYASIEIASFGMPVVFWNLSSASYEEVLEQTRGAVHSFWQVTEFVNFNRRILTDPECLINLGKNLREYVIDENDISKNIKILEDYYLKAAEAAKR